MSNIWLCKTAKSSLFSYAHHKGGGQNKEKENETATNPKPFENGNLRSIIESMLEHLIKEKDSLAGEKKEAVLSGQVSH